jgi:hypothetical protein
LTASWVAYSVKKTASRVEISLSFSNSFWELRFSGKGVLLSDSHGSRIEIYNQHIMVRQHRSISLYRGSAVSCLLETHVHTARILSANLNQSCICLAHTANSSSLSVRRTWLWMTHDLIEIETGLLNAASTLPMLGLLFERFMQ